MKKTKVLFFFDVRDVLQVYILENLSKVENLELIFPDPPTYENYMEIIPDVDILIGWKPKRELLNHAKKLKLFINPGAGVKHLISMMRKINENQNLIMINGHGNSYFTAQHAVAILLAVSNKVPEFHTKMVNGVWIRGDTHGKSTPLRYKTVGFLGYGSINQKVHQFLSGFDLKFQALKTGWKGNDSPNSLTKYTSNGLDDFLRTTNILIIALPETENTIDLITKRELEMLGKDAILVNVARGRIINQSDLYEALNNKTILGAGLDVWYNYNPQKDAEGKQYPYDLKFPFHKLENVVLSPHRAASPFDDLERWDEQIENIKRFCAGRTDFLNIVNLNREY